MALTSTKMLFGCAVATLLVGSIYACGSSSEDPIFTSGGQGGTKTDAKVDTNTGGGNGGAGGTSMLFDAPLNTDQGLNPEAACAAEKVKAEVLPLDLYLMVDRSNSMNSIPDGGTESKWTSQKAALSSFITADTSAGLFMALRFFPLDDLAAPQDPQCSGKNYDVPLVDWGVLPDNASALTAAIDSVTADGQMTPTQEALWGMLKGAYKRQVDQTEHVVAAVIVSDGQPCCDTCPLEDPQKLGQIAAQYLNGQPSIKTFAIFVDATASQTMSEIALQGGTGAPFDATSGQAAFVEALNKIRGSALGCEYKFPQADGGKANKDLVNVSYTPGSGGDSQSVSYVKGGKASCGSGLGWYYDNDASPTKIILCPDTCATIRADDKAEVQILVGCKSTTA